jgi:hypothetical protein
VVAPWHESEPNVVVSLVLRKELGAWEPPAAVVAAASWEAEVQRRLAVIPLTRYRYACDADITRGTTGCSSSANNPAPNRQPRNHITSPAARRRADNHHLLQPYSLPLIPA